jgi:hypothetical protein
MGRHGNRTVGAATALALTAALHAATNETRPILQVRVTNNARLPQRTVDESLEIAGGIYRRSGVIVEWIQDTGDLDTGNGLRIVIVPTTVGSPIPVVEDSMGVVRDDDGVRARVEYVFSARVRDFAEQSHERFWMVLGCAVAHELGHLVLPVNAHAPDGVMRARWDPGMITRAGGLLNFTAEQGRLLRMRVAARER